MSEEEGKVLQQVRAKLMGEATVRSDKGNLLMSMQCRARARLVTLCSSRNFCSKKACTTSTNTTTTCYCK